MDRQKPKRWDKKLIIVTITCLFVASGAGLFLWRDLNGSGSAGQGVPMAKVERREARVKRKAKSSYVWSNIQANESLFLRDSVQTSSGSAAAIRLKDGSLLEMGENSLVVIDQVGDLSLNFLAGHMTLRKDSGVSSVSVGADGKARIEQLPLRLVKPEALARIFTQSREATDVALTWEPTSNQSAAKISQRLSVQVAPDQRFAQATTKNFSPESANLRSVSAKLPAGDYFWRVIDLEQPDRILTSVGKFKIAIAEPLKATWPAAGKKVFAFGSNGALQFRWVPPKDVDESATDVEHQIQFSRDSEFRNIVSGQKISATNGMASLHGLEPGVLYWRILSSFGDQKLASVPQKFEIERKETLALELNSPDENGSTAAHVPMRFSWTSDSSEVDYLWELARVDGESQEIVAKTRSRASASNWKNPIAGLYRWRVTALSGEQNAGESQWRSFAVYDGGPLALELPKKDAAIHYWDKRSEFNFEWASDAITTGRNQYLFEAGNDASFKKPFVALRTRETTIESSKLKLQPGAYFWRVSVVDASGKTLKSSEKRAFTYGPYPALRAPASAKPEPGHIFQPFEEDADPKISWDKVDGAEAYELTITPVESKTPVVRAVTKDTELTVKKLKAGKYTFSVRAIDRIQRRGEPSDVRNFTVSFGQVLPPPDIVSPEVQ